jgi:hypothetical protein
MNAATKRTVIAGAAIAAAGLFGSLPYQGTPQSQQGVPTVHRDVALVDITDATLLTDEGTLDSALYGDLTGAETSLYGAVDTAYGGGTTGAADADALLGAGTAPDAYDNLFDGAYNYGASGFGLDVWAAEDEVNQALGISATTSETAILNDIAADPVLLSGTDTLPTAGSADFDTDLISLANDDYTTATTDFTTYVEGLSTSLGSLDTSEGLSAILTDLGTISSDFTNLTPDLTAVLTDLGSLF